MGLWTELTSLGVKSGRMENMLRKWCYLIGKGRVQKSHVACEGKQWRYVCSR